MAASTNSKLIRRCLKTDAKRKLVEDVLNEKGLEHLLTGGLITKLQT